MLFQWALPAAIALPALVPAVIAPNPGSGFELRREGAAGLGSGCNLAAGDMMIMTMGDDLSLVYTRLALRLPARPSDTSLSGIASCSARIPATLRAGRIVHQIAHSLRYGVEKSAGSSGAIAVLGGFADVPAAGFTVGVPEGAQAASSLSASKNTPFMTESACRGSDTSGLFRADVSISGSRTSAGESLAIGAVGRDLRYDLSFSTAACSP